MQREEKMLEMAVDALIARVNDLRSAIAAFILKLETEHESLSWPTVLDNYALISGQLNSLLKTIKNDKTPPLRNLIILPLSLTPDRDEELLKLTEGRVPALSHDVVPDYLRTKPDPEVEIKEQQLLMRANAISHDTAQKQVNTANKIANHIIDVVNKMRAEWESESNARLSAVQTTNINDTHALISAITYGKNLNMLQSKMGPGQIGAGNSAMSGVPSTGPGGPMMGAGMGGVGKAPSSIKTNIKAGNAMHPYSR